MLPNVLQLISRAIRERRCLALHYDNQRQVRVVEPHAVYTDEHDQLVLDAYQIRGYSESVRPTPFWRPLHLGRITSLSLLRENFAPRILEGFTPNRPKYRRGLVVVIEEDGTDFMPPPADVRRPWDFLRGR
jgi:predicted DNA-binding transcriptional regulator YafY